MSDSWKYVKDSLPPEGQVVEVVTESMVAQKITTKLIRKGNLWFVPDMSMYVYYTPYRWREL